jgi:hypothetical protein
VAFIQAILVGLCLLIAGVPWAGALSAVVLVLGIAQVPALLVTLPAIIYIWSRGGHGNVVAIAYSVLLFLAGMTDNVLKPLLLGRGVDAPMPVILLGALGGMATRGILRHVCRGHAAGARLSDIHGLGGEQVDRKRLCGTGRSPCGELTPLPPRTGRGASQIVVSSP